MAPGPVASSLLRTKVMLAEKYERRPHSLLAELPQDLAGRLVLLHLELTQKGDKVLMKSD